MNTSGNPTLDKNLEAIAVYNPKLAQDILDLPCLTNDFELTETDLKEPNLRYNFVPLHSQQGAEKEAKEAFKDVENNGGSMHIVFGLGIGHLFKECVEQSKGFVFLYEPSLEILRVTLELVDFSEELSKPNVFVASDYNTFAKIFTEVYQYKGNVTYLALRSYRGILFPEEIDKVINKFAILIGTCNSNMNTSIKLQEKSVKSLLENIPYMIKATPLNELKDLCKGKTALVVSAGPTLDRDIDFIKEIRDSVVIFCVGTAFKALMKNGIQPDFVNVLENLDCSGQLQGFDLSEVNLITDTYTNNAIYKLKVKNNFLFASSSPAGIFWSQLTGIDISPYISRGTVAYQALESAKILGCSKIVLAGQDLAYVDNQCYSKNAAYSDLVCEFNQQGQKYEVKIKDKESYIKSYANFTAKMSKEEADQFALDNLKSINDLLYAVKGISGEMIPSNQSLAVFIEHFSTFAQENKQLELINTSLLGAQIDGFENLEIQKALEGTEKVEKTDKFPSFTYNINQILTRLENTYGMLKTVLHKIDETKMHIDNFEKELARRNVVTESAVKSFVKMRDAYDAINVDNQNPILLALTFAEKIEVQAFNSNNGVLDVLNYDSVRVKELYELLKIYYSQAERKIGEALCDMEKIWGIVNESINPKS